MADTFPHPATAKEIVATLKIATADEFEALLDRYKDDPRSQVQKALKVAMNRLEHERLEIERVDRMYEYMYELGGEGIVVGLDEVGRGSVAGPLTVCAVALPLEPRIYGINDSKQLTPKTRSVLAAKIRGCARAIGICHIAPERIDSIGMAAALREAMLGALADTDVEPDAVLIDGNPLHLHAHEQTIVKGDAKVACIAAASIVAKVTRDEIMVKQDAIYPGYGFADSKGYASAEHIAAIKEKGLTPIHRVSFCQNFLETGRLF